MNETPKEAHQQFLRDAARDSLTGTCRTCRYWEPPEDGDMGPGECHRLAPKPAVQFGQSLKTPEELVAEWPCTYATEWCGEYFRRLPITPVPKGGA